MLYIPDFSQRNDGEDPNSIYTDYPPYPDPYLETYRSYSNWNMAKARQFIVKTPDLNILNLSDSWVVSIDEWQLHYGRHYCVILWLPEKGHLWDLEVSSP